MHLHTRNMRPTDEERRAAVQHVMSVKQGGEGLKTAHLVGAGLSETGKTVGKAGNVLLSSGLTGYHGYHAYKDGKEAYNAAHKAYDAAHDAYDHGKNTANLGVHTYTKAKDLINRLRS